jgi:predicted secreted Zn-dependent protease
MRSTDQLARGELSWRIAAKCDGGACVRVASAGEIIFLGDSKSPEGPTLSYTRNEWEAFVAGIKSGDFDTV